MGRKPIANAEKKIFKEIVVLSKTNTVNKISTLDIASRMHLSETIIYSRFPTKKSLMKAAFSYCISELGDFAPFAFITSGLDEKLAFESFRELSRRIKEHENESKYIIGYMQSDYFEIEDLESIESLEVKKLEGILDTLPIKQAEISIKAYLNSLVYVSLEAERDLESLKHAYKLLPNIKL